MQLLPEIKNRKKTLKACRANLKLITVVHLMALEDTNLLFIALIQTVYQYN